MSHDEQHHILGKTEDGYDLYRGPDGLADADRPMPGWLHAVTWGTLVWGLLYFLWMPGGGNLANWGQNKQYDAEMAAARPAAAAGQPAAAQVDLAAMVKDPAAVKAGEEAYSGQCVACHGQGGAGGIGPALNDATWIYGGKPEEVAHTLAKGTSKGMPPFESLPETTRAQLVAYVKSLAK